MFSATRKLVPGLVVPIVRVHAVKFAPISTSAARSAHDDEMLKIGDYPRTKEERERAAKKYNLIPEDYEPYDEGDGWGDYPKLKAIGAFNRDWYDDFDDPVDNKFYGEPLHLDYDLYLWERIDPLEHEKPNFSLGVKFLTFLGIAFAVPTLTWIIDHFKLHINHPWKIRLYPDQRFFEFPPSESSGHH